ncbi:MAG: hypothetical protein E7053_08850 [Lentisphaerae bacterium]|nr:hypothetical protein [Lentisphaerota bacterium]
MYYVLDRTVIRRFDKRLPAMHHRYCLAAQLLCCRTTSLTADGVGASCADLMRCRLFSPLMAATSVPPLDHVRVSTRWQIFYLIFPISIAAHPAVDAV